MEDNFEESKRKAANLAQAETTATLSTMQKVLSEAKDSEMEAMHDDEKARAQLLAAEATLNKAQSLSVDEVDAAELQKSEAIKH